MKSNEEILNELKVIAPRLSSIEKLERYAAPDGYFDSFSSKMNVYAGAKSQDNISLPDAQLSALQSQISAAVPKEYFSEFGSRLMQKIHEDELYSVAPHLAALPKGNTIVVPANYFSQFPKLILHKVSTTSAKATSSGAYWKLFNARLDALAAAIFKPNYTFAFAGAASMIVVGVIMLFKTTQPPCADLLCQLEKVSDAELNAYFENHEDEFKQSLLEVSTKDAYPLNQLEFSKSKFSEFSDEELNKAILD